jgi:hypothetical protein
MALIVGERGEKREGCKIIKILIPFILLNFLFPTNAYAWGAITHSAICREAGGGELNIMGGVAPDMIALHAVTTGDASRDYAHNCFGDSAEPVFGDVLCGISSDSFAAGWRAHQLADSIVHAKGGYSVTKTLFRDLPGEYGAAINHGSAEFVVDAIVLDEFYGGSVFLYVPDRAKLIHNGAVAFYNSNLGSGRAISRANIIDCETARDLSFNWENCIQTNILLAAMLSKESWFNDVRADFADYRDPYARSLSLVNGCYSERIEPAPCSPTMVDWLVPPAFAYASETVSPDDSEKEYLLFLDIVSKRTREISGGPATPEATRRALQEVAGDSAVSGQQRAWAAAMAEMTNGENTTKEELEKNITGRLSRGRDGSAKGAAGGHRISLLPFLPCSAAVFVTLTAIYWFFKRKRR